MSHLQSFIKEWREEITFEREAEQQGITSWRLWYPLPHSTAVVVGLSKRKQLEKLIIICQRQSEYI